MNFYRLKVDQMDDTKYAWASGYGPIAESIDDIPFLKNEPEALKSNLVKFWEIGSQPPGMTLDPGGKQWPDVLGCGQGSPSFFVSEKVLEDLKYAGFDYFRATKMPLADPLPKRLKEVPAPAYYVIEALPGIDVWSVEIPIAEQIAARNEKPPRWKGPYLTKCKASSWAGADLMSPSHGKSLMSIFCTEHVVLLAKEKNWANVKFDLIVAE